MDGSSYLLTMSYNDSVKGTKKKKKQVIEFTCFIEQLKFVNTVFKKSTYSWIIYLKQISYVNSVNVQIKGMFNFFLFKWMKPFSVFFFEIGFWVNPDKYYHF
jgi:hypothetical protein